MSNFSPQAGLASLLFKIRFLRTMLSKMTPEDLDKFYTSCLGILLGETTGLDIETINNLYDRFETRIPSADY